MASGFKTKGSVAKNVRRIARKRLKYARKRLREKDHLESIVHDVRRSLKELRAILRMVRESVGKKVYKRETNAVRKIAAFLAPVRDAHVKLQSLKKICDHAHLSNSKVCEGLQEHLAAKCRRQVNRFDRNECTDKARAKMTTIVGHIDDWEIGGWQSIVDGLQSTYRRGRKCFAVASEAGSAPTFHAWRKRVKDLWYELLLLKEMCPQVLDPLIRRLEWLGDLLGEDHDLVVLEEAVSRIVIPGLRDESLQPLRSAIQARHRHLRNVSLRYGGRLYRKTPAVFCQQLRSVR